MKRVASNIFYITGWLLITVLYIFSTQLDNERFNIFEHFKNHRKTVVTASDDDPNTPLVAHHNAHHKKHKHFTSTSRHKGNHKETNFRFHEQLVAYPGDYFQSFSTRLEPDYPLIRQHKYHYLFFKEINPPPPKNC